MCFLALRFGASKTDVWRFLGVQPPVLASACLKAYTGTRFFTPPSMTPVLAACGGARCIARLGRISSAAREGNLLRMSLSKEQVATAEPAVVEVDDQSDTIAPLHKAAYFDPATIVGCPPQSWVRQHLPHGPPLFAVKNSFTGRWTSYFRWPPPFPFKCTWSRRFWARVAARRCSAVPKR